MVEHSAVNRVVVGSSPTRGVFLRPHGQAVKTSPFHGGIMGSIPVRVTKGVLDKPFFYDGGFAVMVSFGTK